MLLKVQIQTEKEASGRALLYRRGVIFTGEFPGRLGKGRGMTAFRMANPDKK